MTDNMKQIVNQINDMLDQQKEDEKFDSLIDFIDEDLLAISKLIDKVQAIAKDFNGQDYTEDIDRYLNDLI